MAARIMAKEEPSLDDHVVTLNPIVGVNLEDLARTGAEVLQAALLQPVVAAEHVLRFNGELVRILGSVGPSGTYVAVHALSAMRSTSAFGMPAAT